MKFSIDPKGLAAVLSEAKAVAELRARAAGAVQEVKATGKRGAHSGPHIVDAISVGDITYTRDGAEVEIDWNDFRWIFREFGTVNNPPERALTRAAQNQGLRVIDKRT